MRKYCIYVTYHRTGNFYVGKGVTAEVESGKYKGSGTILRDMFKKYPKDEWSTDVVSVFEDEMDCYKEEARLIDEALVLDPLCLNINLGGRGGCRRKQSAEEIARRSVSIKKVLATQERRDHMAQVAIESLNRPEVVEKLKARSNKLWANPEMREKILKARKGKARAYVKVEVDGVEYRSMTAACKAHNVSRKRLVQLTTFKELA